MLLAGASAAIDIHVIKRKLFHQQKNVILHHFCYNQVQELVESVNACAGTTVPAGTTRNYLELPGTRSSREVSFMPFLNSS